MRKAGREEARLARLVLGLVAMACGAGLVLTGLGGGGEVATRGPDPSSATQVLGEVIERTTTTSAPAGRAPSAVAAPLARGAAPSPGPSAAEVGPTTTTTPQRSTTTTSIARSTTTTVGPCADCGSLWTRSPGPNQPIALTVESPSALRQGEDLLITVRAADPDAMVQAPFVCVRSADGAYEVGFHPGDATSDACALPTRCVEQRPRPVAPPDSVGSSGSWTVRLVPPAVGEYTITVDVGSTAMPCQPDPYGSTARSVSRVRVS